MSSWTNTSIWTTHNTKLLYLVCTNVDNLVVTCRHMGMVNADTFH